MITDTPGINIFQILEIVHRRIKLIVGIIIATFLLVLAISFFSEKQSSLRSIMEIGQYQAGQQATFGELQISSRLDFKFFEDPITTCSRYEAWAMKYLKDKQFEPLNIVQKDLNCQNISIAIVMLELEVSDNDLGLTFMEKLNDAVLADHQRFADYLTGSQSVFANTNYDAHEEFLSDSDQKHGEKEPPEFKHRNSHPEEVSQFEIDIASSSLYSATDHEQENPALQFSETFSPRHFWTGVIESRVIESPRVVRVVKIQTLSFSIVNLVLSLFVSFVFSLTVAFLHEFLQHYKIWKGKNK